jgi:hypothetical protein
MHLSVDSNSDEVEKGKRKNTAFQICYTSKYNHSLLLLYMTGGYDGTVVVKVR